MIVAFEFLAIFNLIQGDKEGGWSVNFSYLNRPFMMSSLDYTTLFSIKLN